jgi:type III secretory pathway component EscS
VKSIDAAHDNVNHSLAHDAVIVIVSSVPHVSVAVFVGLTG